jgi:hypothetical protein
MSTGTRCIITKSSLVTNLIIQSSALHVIKGPYIFQFLNTNVASLQVVHKGWPVLQLLAFIIILRCVVKYSRHFQQYFQLYRGGQFYW